MYQGLKRKDHIQAEEKYKAFREVAYEIAMEEFPGIDVRGIAHRDTIIADTWKNVSSEGSRIERGDWSWSREYTFYQKRPNRFEVSLSKGQLGALCYGQLSKHGTRVRLNLIEATPIRPSPLGGQALPILSVVAAAFAEIVGANELWVLDPFPEVQSLYEQQGFSKTEVYHGRRVGQRRIL